MRLILMLIVAIAALNIISGLVMLVKNKGRDIAILRTMGAGQGAILRIFFMAGARSAWPAPWSGWRSACCSAPIIEPIQRFVEWVTGTTVFTPTSISSSHIPAKIDWGEVAVIVAVLAGLLVPRHPAAGLARLAPRSGGGASL